MFSRKDASRPPVTVYQPERFLKSGYIFLLRIILMELLANRWLMFQIFRRDLVTKYKQSFTGIAWAVIIPLFSVSSFVMLHRSGILQAGETEVPYPVFAVIGLSLWQIFAVGLLSASSSLVDAGAMVVKVNFSKKSLVLASMGHAVVSFAVYGAIAAGIATFYGFMPAKEVFLLPFLAVPLVLLTAGVGLIFALLNGIARDFGIALSMGLTMLMFVTPVFFVNPVAGPISALNRFNPLRYLVEVPRDLALHGAASSWTGYLWSSVLAVVVLCLSLVLFHHAEGRIAERV